MNPKKDKPKHIREIKPIRDLMCQKAKGGPQFEYARDIRFADYKTLAEFYKAHPGMRRFYSKHCNEQKVPVNNLNKNLESTYMHANTEWKCDQLDGHWDPKALSRSDYKMLGACFKTKADRSCAAHDNKALMAYKKKVPGALNPPLVMVSKSKTACSKDRSRWKYERQTCQWVPKTGQCGAVRTIEAKRAKNENHAARKIQGQVKVQLLRRRVRALQKDRERNVAARKIQAQARLRKLHKWIQYRKNKASREKAAKLIQRAYVKHVQYKKRHAAAIKIQKAVRTRRKKHGDAAVKIQGVIRKHQGRSTRLPVNWPSNLRESEVDRYLLNYYRKEKNQWPVKSLPVRAIIGENRCKAKPGSEPLFTAPQAILHSVARGMHQVGTNRGLLAWHSTGSGKTCSAAAVMDAYWNSNKNIVFCTSVEAKQANPPETFTKCINTFLKRNITNEAMTRRVKYMSFAQLAHYLQLYRGSGGGTAQEREKRARLLNNAVLIIDEVQNLLKPLPNQAKEHKALHKFLSASSITGKTDHLQVFIFTATPGESPQDVVDLLNLVRDRRFSDIKVPGTAGETLSDFRRKTRGLVQYYNTNNDLSRFPRIVYNKPYMCNMSRAQFEGYAKALKEDLGKKTRFPNPKYFALSRKYSNALFNRESTLTEFSCKIPQIHDNIQRYPNEKHWIYSAFYEARGYGQGIMALRRTLKHDLEYEQLTPAMAKRMLDTKRFTNKRRFCVITTTAMDSKADLTRLLAVYNHDLNVNGQICQVMLASQKFNEGVDLKAVRHIHLMEPLMSDAMIQQAVGRARRNCSHFQLDDMKDWTVQLHEYMSEFDKGKQNNINYNRTIELHEKRLQIKQTELDALKGQRGVKEQRDLLTARVSELKAQIKDLKKSQANQALTDQLFFIDEHIRNFAESRSKPTQQLLNVLRENSINRLIN